MGTFDGLASGLFGGPNVNQPAAQINQAGAQAWQAAAGAGTGLDFTQRRCGGLARQRGSRRARGDQVDSK